MKHVFELVLIGILTMPVVALGANAQKDQKQKQTGNQQPQTVIQISPQEVAAALKQAGLQPPSKTANSMITVPVNRHNVIGGKPKVLKNPYAHQHQAVIKGKELYRALNCAVCHGQKGGGGQGEQLNTGLYRYGGKPADLYLSIAHGRPAGMPSWGTALSPEAIWYLVTYVKTLPSTTPNHPHKTPAALERKKLQAPIIRTFAMPKHENNGSGDPR